MSNNQETNPTIPNFADPDGTFRRPVSSFRSQISSAPGSRYPPEAGRYHLYVSYGCPWAHRTLIVRALKGLEGVIGMSVTLPWLGEGRRWPFLTEEREARGEGREFEGCTRDLVGGKADMGEVYLSVEPGYTGRFTVPVLYDTQTHTIVNNESSEIIRMFYHEFDHLLPPGSKERELNPLPKELEKEIDEMNEWVYETVNNGVYKTGFATTQEAYESALYPLFASLDRLESHLTTPPTHASSSPHTGGPYLLGPNLTEADVRLYTTLIRFDVAYVGAFKCNIRTIRHGYPVLHSWLRRLYWGEWKRAFGGTTRFEHIKRGYYGIGNRNGNVIIPLGPKPDIEPPTEPYANWRRPIIHNAEGARKREGA